MQALDGLGGKGGLCNVPCVLHCCGTLSIAGVGTDLFPPSDDGRDLQLLFEHGVGFGAMHNAWLADSWSVLLSHVCASTRVVLVWPANLMTALDPLHAWQGVPVGCQLLSRLLS